MKVGKHFTWVLSSYPKIMTLERVKGKGPKIMILERVRGRGPKVMILGGPWGLEASPPRSPPRFPGDDPRKYPGKPKGTC